MTDFKNEDTIKEQWNSQMKLKIFNLFGLFILLLGVVNCSELTFRSDPLSMTMVKYENRSPNKYIFLAHEGDDCHLLRHKRIHNFFFFFPLNTFSKEEIHEISQQKMIRYKNIMRLGDFAWTLFLLPVSILTYSIEVETCNTGMVAVTRRDPLYLDSLKNTKTGTKKEEAVAILDPEKGKSKKNKSIITQKSIQPSSEKEELGEIKPEPKNTKEVLTSDESKEPKRILPADEAKEPKKILSIEEKNESKEVLKTEEVKDSKDISKMEETKELEDVKPTKRKLRFKERPTDETESTQANLISTRKEGLSADDTENTKKVTTGKKKKKHQPEQIDPNLAPEAVWDSAAVLDESVDEPLDEAKEEFNPDIYKIDGTLPIIWNYKNSITNKINENVKPFSILFSKNGAELSPIEEKKLDAFAAEYLESYGTSKIMLIGHSEWAKGKGAKLTLSQHRAEAVRNYLLQKKIPTENILLSFSGGLWGENNEEKYGKKFSRRVDIVFLY